MKKKTKAKYLERILPGTKRTPDSRPFFIPQINKLEDKETLKQKFVSPIFGKSVKDEVTVPNDHKYLGDIDKKYDAFRKTKKLTKEEAKKRYGDSYYEFFSVSNKDLSKIHQGDLSADDILKKKQEEVAIEVTPMIEKPVEVPMEDFFGAAKEFEESKERTPMDDVLRDIANSNNNHEELDENRFSPMEEDDILFESESDLAKKKIEPEVAFDDDFDYVESAPIKKSPLPTSTIEKIRKQVVNDYDDYNFPPVTIFKKSKPKAEGEASWIQEQIDVINQTLLSFDIDGSVSAYTKGPTVTRYEISLGAGVQIKKITGISDNIQMNLSALSLRIEAPIPGKNTVGVEVPNKVRESVFFGDVVDNVKFLQSTDPLYLAIGLDIDAKPVYTSIENMPHGLVAGSTQSGKSVCIASMIASLLYKNKPDQVKLLLIDPKKVDLQQFSDIPHLVTPIIDEPKLAIEALKWAVMEMERRYDVLKKFKSVDVKDYYRRRLNDPEFEKMPRIVIIVEEASDLLISGGPEIEEGILKLTQKSRAVGIHLLLATQRPSADILKGAIKANLPTRFAFKVPSSTDSSVVLDTTGAEKLLGKGDMLLSENGLIRRLQGAYLSPEEIEELTEFIKGQAYPQYLFTHEKLISASKTAEAVLEIDELFGDIARYVVEEDRCSLNKITQEFGIGFNRATQIVSSLESHGIVSENAGTKPREVLVGYERLEEILQSVGKKA
ncbi:MAG: DNA translocase FtsK [Firmicutes bacterium]|nr:DNA translocase FtsK [Bacillota bacterium]